MARPRIYPTIEGESTKERNRRLDKEWVKKNRKKLNDDKRRTRAENPLPHRQDALKAQKKFRENNPEEYKTYQLDWHRKKSYGISAENYAGMLEEQGGVCQICRKTNADGRRLSVDHNHETGVIRGLLCTKCNLGLGYFNDSSNTLEDALLYLREHE